MIPHPLALLAVAVIVLFRLAYELLRKAILSLRADRHEALRLRAELDAYKMQRRHDRERELLATLAHRPDDVPCDGTPVWLTTLAPRFEDYPVAQLEREGLLP